MMNQHLLVFSVVRLGCTVDQCDQSMNITANLKLHVQHVDVYFSQILASVEVLCHDDVGSWNYSYKILR